MTVSLLVNKISLINLIRLNVTLSIHWWAIATISKKRVMVFWLELSCSLTNPLSRSCLYICYYLCVIIWIYVRYVINVVGELHPQERASDEGRDLLIRLGELKTQERTLRWVINNNLGLMYMHIFVRYYNNCGNHSFKFLYHIVSLL